MKAQSCGFTSEFDLSMTSSYRVRYRFGYERQACSFEFDKHYRRRRAEETEGFVVLPGFNKVIDERGNLIGGQQVLVRPMTHRPRRDR